MKKIIDKALIDYRASGQGEGGLSDMDNIGSSNEDDDDSLSSLENDCNKKYDTTKGVSKVDSLKKYSAEFFSFVNHNPVAFYFYIAFVKYDMLESCSSDMSDEHAGSSKVCKSAGYGINNGCKRKTVTNATEFVEIDDDKGATGKKKVVPIVKAAAVLASTFASTIASNTQNDKNKMCEDDKIKKVLLEADEAGKIVSNDDGSDPDLTRYKKAYLGRMKEKVRILLKIDE